MSDSTLVHGSLAVCHVLYGAQVGYTLGQLSQEERKLWPQMLLPILLMAVAAGVLSFSLPSPTAKLICLFCIATLPPLACSVQMRRLRQRGAPRSYLDYLGKVARLSNLAATLVAAFAVSLGH